VGAEKNAKLPRQMFDRGDQGGWQNYFHYGDDVGRSVRNSGGDSTEIGPQRGNSLSFLKEPFGEVKRAGLQS